MSSSDTFALGHFMRAIFSGGVATIIQNGFMFAVNLAMIKFLAPTDYASFAFALTLSALSAVLVNSFVATQMGIHLAAYRSLPARQAAGRMFSTVTVACILAYLPVVVAGCLYTGGMTVWTIVATVAVVGANMYRNYVRSYFFAIRANTTVIKQDFINVMIGFTLMGLGFVLFRGHDLLLASFWAIAISAFATNALLSSAPRPATSWRTIGRHVAAFERYKSKAGWTFLLVLLANIAGMSPTFALVGLRDFADLALVAAPGALFAPIRLAFTTMQSVLRSEISLAVKSNRLANVVKIYAWSVGLVAAVCVAVAVAVVLAWNLLYHHIYGDQYAEGAIWAATVMTFVFTALSAIRIPGAILLNALGVYKTSTLVMSVVCPVAIVVSVIGARSAAAYDVLWGSIVMESLMFAADAVLIIRSIRVWQTGHRAGA